MDERLWVPCEHGEIGWHGEMMGGCAGGRWAEVSDLVEALQAEDDAVVVTRGHWAGDGIAVTVAGHGRYLVVPLGEDA